MTERTRLALAMTNPAEVYAAPEDVLADDSLGDMDKIEILRRWNYDACEISVAEDEGMTAPNDALLQRILLALDSLGVDIDREITPSTGRPEPPSHSSWQAPHLNIAQVGQSLAHGVHLVIRHGPEVPTLMTSNRFRKGFHLAGSPDRRPPFPPEGRVSEFRYSCVPLPG